MRKQGTLTKARNHFYFITTGDFSNDLELVFHTALFWSILFPNHSTIYTNATAVGFAAAAVAAAAVVAAAATKSSKVTTKTFFSKVKLC